MGIQDRDYFVEKLREIEGYSERARFRVPLGRPRWIKPTGGLSAGEAIAVAIGGAVGCLALLAVVLRH